MKVYLHEQGFILVGKGWEVVQKLREYNKHYSSVKEWIKSMDSTKR